MYITYLMLHNTIFMLEKPTHNIQFVSFILSIYHFDEYKKTTIFYHNIRLMTISGLVN